MFGRGQRDDLDDDDGEKLASDLRNQLREELKRMQEVGGAGRKLERL